MSKIRLEDDFYLFQNQSWFDNAVIPNDKPLTGSFVEIMMNNEKTLMADLKEFALNGVDHKLYKNELFDNFIKIYKKAINKEQRDKEGNDFIVSLINKVSAISSFEQLQTLNIESDLTSIEYRIYQIRITSTYFTRCTK